MARTGMRTERATSSRAAMPAGGEPGWLGLSQTGPKMTKSAPSRSARCADVIEWTERPTRRRPRSVLASAAPMSLSGRLTPAAPAASATSHRELMSTGSSVALTSSFASRSRADVLSSGARSWRMVALDAALSPAVALLTTAIATGRVKRVARCPRSESSGWPRRAWVCAPRCRPCGPTRRPSDRFGHQDRVLGERYGAVDQHGVGAELHGKRGVRRRADSRVDDDWDPSLFDDDANLLQGLKTLA